MTIVNVLAIFPQEERAIKRARNQPVEQVLVPVSPLPSPGTSSSPNEHHWSCKDNCWFCCLCLISSARLPSKPELPCEPGNLANNLERTISKGHKLMIVQPQGNSKSKVCSTPLLWCTRCGKWTQQILRGLADDCLLPTGRQRQHLKVLLDSTHPKCKLTKLVNGFAVNPSFWSTRWHALALKSGLSNSCANACAVAPTTSLTATVTPPVTRDRGGGFDDPEAFKFDEAAAEQEYGGVDPTAASSSSTSTAVNRRLRSKTKCS